MQCSRCRNRKVLRKLKICKVCSDYFRRWSKGRIRRDKKLCMDHYGDSNGGCVCCHESRICFLSIDHIKDDGFKNRNKHGLGKHLYRMLVKNNFPSGFQTLCFNCQWGKRLNGGFCPHNPAVDLRKS